MKIALIVPHLEEGGMPKLVSTMSRAWQGVHLVTVVLLISGMERNYDVAGDVVELAPRGKGVFGKALAVARRVFRARRLLRSERFDAVIIPDSIGYMTTEDDLRAAIETTNAHLPSGGVLLVTATIKDEFRNNNFVYTGSRGDVEIVVFENNYILPSNPAIYEATIVYLIRRGGVREWSDSIMAGLTGRRRCGRSARPWPQCGH